MISPASPPVSGDSPTGESLPATTPPVPVRHRYDGWTPERQAGFLRALAECGDVKASVKTVGMSRRSAYDLKRHPDGKAFSRAWEAALIHARDAYQEALLAKGLNG